MENTAVVIEPIAPLMKAPTLQCELADEALHGMVVEVLETVSNGWARVRTHYNYEGYAKLEHLVIGSSYAVRWEGLPKKVVLKAQADVLSAPRVQSFLLLSLTRGAVLAVRSEANGDGWVRVALADGREGYTRESFLGEYVTAWSREDEPALRWRLMDTALSYLGTQYRWGGKTPQGIDCSGLTSMAYLLNGILIYRDADIREGFAMRKISVEEIKEGDLIFFKGHVAMHLGGGRIVHSTSRRGSDGVVLNSLNPKDEDYRPDLIESITFAGTVF